MEERSSVLIVGGSLNGLSMALLLADQGVDCIVVERHSETTIQYKFAGISPRTMEIYRGLGLEAEIRASRTGDQKSGEIASGRTLSDPDIRFMGKPWADTAAISAATAETCDQHRLEPILRSHAERRGAAMRFGWEMVEFEQLEDGVTAQIRNLSTGAEQTIVANYLIAADGGAGTIRERLGIDRHGAGALQHWMNLIFATDMEPALLGRRFTSCFVTEINGSFTPGADGWLLAVQYRPEHGESPADFDADAVGSLVRQGAGRDDIRVDPIDARSWEVAAYVADQFRQERVFLIGDTAHLMPPTGGFGGNTGIHDAHNLAWKLAYVLNGRADAALLNSYDSERRPVAERTLAQAMARLSAWFNDPSKKLPEPEPVVDDMAVIFGASYSSGAVLDEAGHGAAFEDPRHPSGRPGTRAPHLVLQQQGRSVPLHDLLGQRYTLLTGADGKAWQEVARHQGIDLAICEVGSGASEFFQSLYGVGSNGAVLIRPDGYIAWRSRSSSDKAGVELPRVIGALALGSSGCRMQNTLVSTNARQRLG